MASQENSDTFIQKWALPIGLGVYGIFLVFYVARFALGPWISEDAQAWGQFGDYVGGSINPVVGLITIWLLTASLQQSRREMALTTEAMENAAANQASTEAALRDQIAVAKQARDMVNAIELWRYHKDRAAHYDALLEEISAGRGKTHKITEYLNEKKYSEASLEKLEILLGNETDRLADATVELEPEAQSEA